MSENQHRSQMVPTIVATAAAVLTLTVLRRLDAHFADPLGITATRHYLALGLNMAISVGVFALVTRALGRGPR